MNLQGHDSASGNRIINGGVRISRRVATNRGAGGCDFAESLYNPEFLLDSIKFSFA
jgi:hypothetical protein